MRERILILRSGVLGDFIISTPAMALIRERYPNAKIYLLTIPSAHKKDRNVIKVYETKKSSPWLDLIDTSVIDRVIEMKEVGFSYLVKHIRPIVKRINPSKCYVLTDPLVGIKGNIAKVFLLKMLGARCKVYGWKDFVRTNKEKRKADESKRCINHTLSCIESVLEDESFNSSKYTVRFPIVIPKEGTNEANSIWDEYDLADKRVIVLSPGGVKPHKIWSVDGYVKVIKCLIREDELLSVILTGTNKDIELGKRICDEVKSTRVINLIGQTDLPCLAGILYKADLLFGNDGGTMHLGDAVGCTVVAIMPGIELPNTVEPWHNINNSLRKKVSCSPCYDFDHCPNRTYECMKKIKAEDVLSSIKKAETNRKTYNSVQITVDRKRKIPKLHVVEDKL